MVKWVSYWLTIAVVLQLSPTFCAAHTHSSGDTYSMNIGGDSENSNYFSGSMSYQAESGSWYSGGDFSVPSADSHSVHSMYSQYSMHSGDWKNSMYSGDAQSMHSGDWQYSMYSGAAQSMPSGDWKYSMDSMGSMNTGDWKYSMDSGDAQSMPSGDWKYSMDFHGGSMFSYGDIEYSLGLDKSDDHAMSGHSYEVHSMGEWSQHSMHSMYSMGSMGSMYSMDSMDSLSLIHI